MRVSIKPSFASGEVKAPPSKSMAHRLLICAALGENVSEIYNVAFSDDIKATLGALSALGAKCRALGNRVAVGGIDFQKTPSQINIDCRECGSTLRFIIPICLLTGSAVKITGSRKLLSRPLSVYEQICEENGFDFENSGSEIRLCGKLTPGNYTVPGNISSQFVSGLLFALPMLDGASTVTVTKPIESLSYIKMTLEAMRRFGIDLKWNDGKILIKGNCRYVSRGISVEGDYSNAAFFEALNLVGGNVKVTGLNPDSLQGDRVYKKYFDELKNGAAVINIEDCPDLGPVLFAAAAALGGGRFTGTARLKIKESDRGEAMREELSKFGVHITVTDNEIIVPDSQITAPKMPLSGHNDHRIVMALSVLLTKTGGVIDGAEAVKKSFPDFFKRLSEIGVEVNTNAMDMQRRCFDSRSRIDGRQLCQSAQEARVSYFGD